LSNCHPVKTVKNRGSWLSILQALIDSGDKEQMEVEVASLLRGINATQKHDARCRLRRTWDGWDMVGYGGIWWDMVGYGGIWWDAWFGAGGWLMVVGNGWNMLESKDSKGNISTEHGAETV